MAQFDLIIIFPIIWSLLITLILNYWLLLKIILPNFISLLKFRKKILNVSTLKVLSIQNIANY